MNKTTSTKSSRENIEDIGTGIALALKGTGMLVFSLAKGIYETTCNIITRTRGNNVGKTKPGNNGGSGEEKIVDIDAEVEDQ